MKTGIIAGSYKEALEFVAENKRNWAEFQYLGTPIDLFGRRENDIILGPNFEQSPVWEHARIRFGTYWWKRRERAWKGIPKKNQEKK